MQNRAKMCSSRSSGARAPLTSSSAARASDKSASTNSSDIETPSANAAARARASASCAALDERDVADVGDRRPIAQQIDIERLDDLSAATSSSPRAGRRRHRDRAIIASQARRQIGLVCDDKSFAYSA